jgi:signal transduction histidine kinase/PAS domain-containing protein
MMVDRNGAIRAAEGSALELLGLGGEDDLVGRSASDVFQEWPAIVRGVESALRGCPERAQLTTRNETIVLQLEPRLRNGRPDGAVVAGVDAVLPVFLRQLPGVIWSTDRELRITSALGRIPAELDDRIVGVSVGEILGTFDASDPAIAHHRAALRGEPQSFMYPFHERWYQVNIEPLRDESGAPCGCVGTAVDVTDRRYAMAQLEKTVSLLHATLEATADGLLVVDRTGRVTAYNDAFSKMWRLPVAALQRGVDAALLDMAREQLENPEDFSRGVEDLYAHPERESFDVLHLKDGRVFERSSRPERIGETIIGRVWSFRDVTERERLLGRALFLAEATRLLASLDVERALQAVVQLAVPYMADDCTIEIFDGLAPVNVFTASREHSRPLRTDLPRAVVDGHPTIFGDRGISRMAVPLLAQGKAVGAISFVAPAHRRYETSDLELAEQLAERAALGVENARLYRGAQDALRARDEFLSIVAHEIRSPLTSIHLCAQTMRRKAEHPAELLKSLDIVEREDRRLSRFVDELLDVGRIQGGRFHFDLEQVDFAEVAQSVVAQLGAELARARSPITVTTQGPVWGRWDRFRLEQVVTNLLSNALKFGEGKAVEITIGVADGVATLQVRDHGTGIAPETKEKIFLPFERGVSTRHFGGLGLGLYIVHTIVEGLGGTIEVDSRPGEGSTFTVHLPQAKAC